MRRITAVALLALVLAALTAPASAYTEKLQPAAPLAAHQTAVVNTPTADQTPALPDHAPTAPAGRESPHPTPPVSTPAADPSKPHDLEPPEGVDPNWTPGYPRDYTPEEKACWDALAAQGIWVDSPDVDPCDGGGVTDWSTPEPDEPTVPSDAGPAGA